MSIMIKKPMCLFMHSAAVCMQLCTSIRICTSESSHVSKNSEGTIPSTAERLYVHFFFSVSTGIWYAYIDETGWLSLLLKVMWKYQHHTPLLLFTEVEKSILYIREKGQGPVRRMFANSTEQERRQLMRRAYEQLPWPHQPTTTRHRSRHFTVCF